MQKNKKRRRREMEQEDQGNPIRHRRTAAFSRLFHITVRKKSKSGKLRRMLSLSFQSWQGLEEGVDRRGGVKSRSDLIIISTNLYGSLWFGTNERVLLRRRYPTIASLCAPITTTKGEGYYVKFFLYVPSPWSRSQTRKGNQRDQMTIRSIYKERRIFLLR